MTQKLVLELPRELGGKANTRDILNLAKQKYPNLELHSAHKLMRLQIWGYVQHDRINGIWSIVETQPTVGPSSFEGQMFTKRDESK